MNQNLMNNLSQPVNHVAQAYEQRTDQLTQQREADEAKASAAQQQRDNDMLKVFEFAGDGRTEEAKYLAQAKGLEVPEQIYTNGDFAKGLSTAGNFYGDDPAGAQRFTMAWMQTQSIPDYAQRVIESSKIAGIPINPENRKFQQQIQLERFKADLKRDGRREDLFIDATTESLGSFTPDDQAGTKALEAYDQAFPRTQPSAGLVGGDPMANSQSAIQQRQSEIGANPYQSQLPMIQVDGGQQSNIPAYGGGQAPVPSGLPQGSVMIGTTNGRPVYQAPNGDRFVDDGNTQNQ